MGYEYCYLDLGISQLSLHWPCLERCHITSRVSLSRSSLRGTEMGLENAHLKQCCEVDATSQRCLSEHYGEGKARWAIRTCPWLCPSCLPSRVGLTSSDYLTYSCPLGNAIVGDALQPGASIMSTWPVYPCWHTVLVFRMVPYLQFNSPVLLSWNPQLFILKFGTRSMWELKFGSYVVSPLRPLWYELRLPTHHSPLIPVLDTLGRRIRLPCYEEACGLRLPSVPKV